MPANVRIALANIRVPDTPAESVALAERAVAEAGAAGTAVVCFPECYVPGCRGLGKTAVVDPDGMLLAYQPYGIEGLLVADLDLSLATGLLAKRYRPV